MIGYACKYTPVELICALSGEAVFLNCEADSFETAESICHSNLCCYSKSLIENCRRSSIKELVLVNCCDSIRRVYDALKAEGNMDFLFLMDLPNCDGACAQDMLKSELLRFAREYGEYNQSDFDGQRFHNAFEAPKELPKEPFVGILGARVNGGLTHELQMKLPYPLVDLTCCGNRQVARPDMPYKELNVKDYAAELLSQPPCMRMEQPRIRAKLLQQPGLIGLIYNTVSFCDYYSFEYEEIRNLTKLPMLKIETDYLSHGSGQLSTRIEAFAEGLGRQNQVKRAKSRVGRFVAGIDSGSTTTNIAVMDRAAKLCASAIVRTGPKAQIGASKALAIVLEQLGIVREDLAYIVATGYGRNSIGFADEAVTEISCHAKGAHFLNPHAETVIDIGGQDSKVIRLDNDGNVINFVMNDKCAAGTGRFLEMMARTLEMEMDEMGKKGLRWKKDLTISSVCSVFAESEVISLIADNHSEPDIIHGLNKAVATKTAALASRVGGTPVYMMTGGVARNRGVVEALKEKLGASVWVAEEPDLCGAIGAALYAHATAFPVAGFNRNH